MVILMEWLRGGHLLDHLEEMAGQHYSEQQAAILFVQVSPFPLPLTLWLSSTILSSRQPTCLSRTGYKVGYANTLIVLHVPVKSRMPHQETHCSTSLSAVRGGFRPASASATECPVGFGSWRRRWSTCMPTRSSTGTSRRRTLCSGIQSLLQQPRAGHRW